MVRTSKISAKDKYERQKELARERQRRRRAKLSEEQKEAKKKYDRDRREKLKKEGKLKTVADMTSREHRKWKKYWRERNKARSLKKRGMEEATANTPPLSPVGSPEVSIQKKRGRKIVRKDRAKAYRTIKKQEEKIKKLERSLEKYRKRFYRQKEKGKSGSPSPMKRVKELVGKQNVSDGVRKQLFLGFVLQKQLKDRKKEMSASKKKSQLAYKVLGNKIIKKYRVQKHFSHLVPYKVNKILGESHTFDYTRREKKSVIVKLREQLTTFFQNDCVSKMCPGKKDFVKKGGIKMQRRILLEPLHVLHEKFQKEFKCNISLSSFCRARPFWVTRPKKADRETCACIKHSNMGLIVRALKQAKVIREGTPREVVKKTTCSDNEECLMSRCLVCIDREIEFTHDTDFKLKYFQWRKIKEKRTIKNKVKFVQRTVKENKTEKISKIKSEFKKMIGPFKQHVFYTKHQAKELEDKLNNLDKNELAFRIDFSENYVCKYESEIQSVHFGASKKQLSLNTGVVYFKENEDLKTECFASVSDNLDHQAHAVWGHMTPILKRYSARFPKTEQVHFFSDGPSNQYRNKFNLKLFQTIVPQYFPNMTKMTWNYTEAGHGKGPMDGVGGTLKRQADWKVLYGTDITCAKEFVDASRETNVHLVEIPPQEIESMKKSLASMNIPAVKGIMQVHQITYSQGIMYARSLSCFGCPPSQYCDHYTLFEVFPNEDLDEEIVPTTKCRRLRVDDVFSDTEEESHSEDKCSVSEDSDEPSIEKLPLKKTLSSGSYVLVRYNNQSKTKKTQDFVGVCQSDVVNEELEIMFLKQCTKDESLFVVNESDVATVSVEQIIEILPTPTISLKGNRVFYKFKQLKHL